MRIPVETTTGHRADLVIARPLESGPVSVKAVAKWNGIELPGLELRIFDGEGAFAAAEAYALRVKDALES